MDPLSEAMRLFLTSRMEFVWLDEPMFPDPIVKAEDAETFQSLHMLMCRATGSDPSYVSVRRVADWLGAYEGGYDFKAKAAHA
jgi:hypothetical protein